MERDESLEDTDNLPAPEVIAAEIVEDLQAALDQFSEIASTLAVNDGAPARSLAAYASQPFAWRRFHMPTRHVNTGILLLSATTGCAGGTEPTAVSPSLLCEHVLACKYRPAARRFPAGHRFTSRARHPPRRRRADRVHEELDPYREDPATYLLEAAYGLHNAYVDNERIIERRELVFGLALLALGAETLLWVLALALT